LYKLWPEYCPYYDIPGSLLQPVDTKTLLPEWMDIQARDDEKSDGYIVSFDIVADEHIVSNQSISIIPTWSKPHFKWAPPINLALNSIIFDNIKIDVNEGILTVCDITTYKCGNHIQEGNVLNDPDSSLEVKFKTPLYDWLLDLIL
jgi:hypothetical protein